MYKILSLSGGGVRGIYQAAYLRKIAPSLPKPLCKNFDLIAGTSTGSIVAAGVAFDIDLNQIVKLFETRAGAIFSGRRLSGFRSGPHYNSDPLREELDRVFEKRKLSEASTPLLVAATVLHPRYAPKQFSTFTLPGPVWDDPEFKVVDVIMASCAAPSYFKPQRLDHPRDRRTFVDGGMWANSPSLDAVISAHHYAKKAFTETKVLTLGNGETAQTSDPVEFENLRPFSKQMIRSLFDIMFAAQSVGADQLTEMLLPEGHMLQLNSTLHKPIALDDVESALRELPALAEHDAVERLPRIVAFLSSSEVTPPPKKSP